MPSTMRRRAGRLGARQDRVQGVLLAVSPPRPSRSSSWKRIASVIIAVSSPGSVVSVVFCSPFGDVDARVLGQQLEQRGQAARQVGEVEPDGTDPLAHAVDERVERVDRTAVRRAERDHLGR